MIKRDVLVLVLVLVTMFTVTGGYNSRESHRKSTEECQYLESASDDDVDAFYDPNRSLETLSSRCFAGCMFGHEFEYKFIVLGEFNYDNYYRWLQTIPNINSRMVADYCYNATVVERPFRCILGAAMRYHCLTPLSPIFVYYKNQQEAKMTSSTTTIKSD